MRSITRVFVLFLSGAITLYVYSLGRQIPTWLSRNLPQLGAGPKSTQAAEAAPFDGGVWERRKYTNKQLGFSMTIPEDWYVADQDTTDALTDRGMTFITNGDPFMTRAAELAKTNTKQLLIASEYAPGKPGKINNNIVVTVENLRGYPGVASASDYAMAVEEMLRKTSIGYEFGVIKKRVLIGGMKAACLPASIHSSAGQPRMQQRFYCVRLPDAALSFVLTYQDDIGFEKLRVIMNSIRFDGVDPKSSDDEE